MHSWDEFYINCGMKGKVKMHEMVVNNLCTSTAFRNHWWWPSWNCIRNPLGRCRGYGVCFYHLVWHANHSSFVRWMRTCQWTLSPTLFMFFLHFAPCTVFICYHYVNRGLIVPSKEKKKDKRSKLMRKLGRSRSENVVTQSQRAPGLVGLLETMRVQMEVILRETLM